MQVKINGLNINYITEGNGPNVILLHGWGGCIDSWFPVTQRLKTNYRVWVLDLPGFGKSDTPTPPFDFYSYGDLIGAFIRQGKIEKPIIIGHSFGGSIAAGIAARYPELVNKVVLTDSSGIRIRNLRIFFLNLLAEVGKYIFSFPLLSHFYHAVQYLFYKMIGEEDYLKAGKLKATFSALVKQDIQNLLPEIKSPTLLIWGEKDKATPVWHGEIFKKLVPDSELIIFPHCSHFAYLENPERFCEEVEKFIENQ